MPSRRNLFRLLIAVVLAHPVHAADQHWLRISSDHFVVITDAPDKAGHDVAARFEQMRAIFGALLVRNKIRMGEPLEIIAIASDKEYEQLAPTVNNQPISSPGFWIPGEDRIFIVLNVSQPDSWRRVEHQFAHYMLDYNYPPTPTWFDEGFAEYFASLNLTNKAAEFGSDPELHPAYETDLLGNEIETRNPKSFTEILQNPVWLAWTDLLTMKNRVVNGREGTHHTLFYAQSWILVHYLLNKDKMSELGQYFGLVQLQKMPVEQAIQQAFGMSIDQLDHEVKAYFHSLTPLFTSLDALHQPNAPKVPEAVNLQPLPFAVPDVSTSSKDIRIPQAQALVDEMELRIPERAQHAFDDLEKLTDDPKTETVIAHRALAWAYVQRGDTNKAFEELTAAMHIGADDPWTRLGLALASYHSGEQGARVQGLANMMESLHIVIGEYPEFAEAYNMLGWAQLSGGGPSAAIESMKMAVQLNPRDEGYQLRLAEAYFGAKKFDEASVILNRLKQSNDPQIVRAASKDLNDLPFLEKYGVPPEDATASKPAAGLTKTTSSASAKHQPAENDDDNDDDDNRATAKAADIKPKIDNRPVKFLKAKLVSIDCSKKPAAMLSVSANGRTMILKVADYNSVAVIGADNFSCAWKNIPVNLNYRASGKISGDLVSIEIP